MLKKAVLAAVGAVVMSQPASAASIVGTDALNEWNLIVLGDLTANNAHIHGRAFVGGTATASGTGFNQDGSVSTRGQPGVTVVGSLTGSSNSIWGGATIGGNSSAFPNLNGGLQTVLVGGSMPSGSLNGNTVKTGQSAVSGFTSTLTTQKTDLINSMISLSDSLSHLSATTSTASATFANNTATFNVTGTGLNVINITSANLASVGQISFANAGTTIINVAGTNVSLDDNFIGTIDTTLGQKVIWNFYEATDLTLSRSFYGTVFAPEAKALINQDIYGTAVFGSATINNEVHLGTFNGTPPAAVPEPATWAMMIAGFGMVGAGLRRRRTVAAVA